MPALKNPKHEALCSPFVRGDHEPSSCRTTGGKHGKFWRLPLTAALVGGAAVLSLMVLLSPAAPQDIRGLEVCTAEKQMERRTGCLQANVELLQQALAKFARETQDKITASSRDLTAARAEIAVLKTTIEKLSSELAQMKAKADLNGKK